MGCGLLRLSVFVTRVTTAKTAERIDVLFEGRKSIGLPVIYAFIHEWS